MKTIAIDTETTSVDARTARLVSISICLDNGKSTATIWGSDLSKQIVKKIEDDKTLKVFHNAKFDIRVLRNAGVDVGNNIADTMIAAQLFIPSKRFGLKHLTRTILKEDYPEKDELDAWVKKNKKHMSEAPSELLLKYNRKDAVCTMKLWHFLYQLIQEHKSEEVFWREMNLMLTCVIPMEDRGLLLDVDRCMALYQQAGKLKRDLVKWMRKYTANPKLNPNSNAQIARYIFPGPDDLDELARVKEETGVDIPTRMPIETTASGKAKVDEYCLKRARTKLAKAVLKYRKVRSAYDRYLCNFLEMKTENNVIHATFNQNGARTGRFSCQDPNLQNLPRRGKKSILSQIRSVFIPRPGYIYVFFDYDQIEIRLAAALSGQDYMLDAIRGGKDLHEMSAQMYFNTKKNDPGFKQLRQIAKTQNYVMLYGAGAYKLHMTLLKEADIMVSVNKCAEYIDKYWQTNAKIRRYMYKLADEVYDNAGLRNPYGRFIPVEYYMRYKAGNTVIQSTAGDIIKAAMPRCMEILEGTHSHMVLMVHDELVFEIHKSETHLIPSLKDAMEEKEKFDVDITCSISWGKNWLDKQPLNLDKLRKVR